jgi:hypothetical protein
MKVKIKYLTQRGRMEFKEDKAFPAILGYAYAQFIRVRGEIMILKEKKYSRLSWSQVMEMTDEQFCEFYHVSKETFESMQKDGQKTNELDLPKRRALKYGVKNTALPKRTKKTQAQTQTETQ